MHGASGSSGRSARMSGIDVSDSNDRRLFPRFVFVGTVGFLVDAVFLQVLFMLGYGPFLSRAFSVVVAMTATWYLNRTVVFQTSAAKGPEYLRHLVAQSVGMAVNIVVYSGLLLAFPVLQDIPVIALIGGSLAAMIFNFFAAKFWTFRQQH